MTGGFVRYAPTAGPSRWLLVAGRRFVAAVESTVSDQIVDAVYWLADSDLATIESVVGAFPLAGPESVRSFAVAELGEPNAAGEVTVTAVVRGGAAIDVFSVGGSRRFSAGGVQPWVLAEFRAVNGLVLQGDDAATGPVARLAVGSLPLRVGVADGELLTWTLKPIERAARGAAPAAQPAQSAAEDDAAVDETIIRGRNPSSSLFGGRAEADTPSAPAGPLLIDTDDALALTEPAVPPPAPAAFAARLPSGDSVALDVPLVVGRRPALQRVASGAEPRLVTVASPTQEVSSTHVRIEQSGDAIVVTDLRSTNGTVVTGPGGARRLRPGESAVVLAGARVEIGDGNIIEITEAREEGRE